MGPEPIDPNRPSAGCRGSLATGGRALHSAACPVHAGHHVGSLAPRSATSGSSTSVWRYSFAVVSSDLALWLGGAGTTVIGSILAWFGQARVTNRQRQGRQARDHATSRPGPLRSGGPLRRTDQRPADPAADIGQADRPSRRLPDGHPGREGRQETAARQPAVAPTRGHHQGPRRRTSAPRRPGPRTSGRPQNHRALRPRPREPRPPRSPLPHRIRRRRPTAQQGVDQLRPLRHTLELRSSEPNRSPRATESMHVAVAQVLAL